MKMKLITFSFIFAVTNSYGRPSLKPIANGLTDNIDKSKYITKEYCPDWLKDSDNMSGYELILKCSLLWNRFISPEYRITIILNKLPKSGINPDDPKSFNEYKLLKLNEKIPNREKNAPFETRIQDDADMQYTKLLSRDLSGVDKIQQMFAEGTLKPSQLVERIYYWYDVQLEDHMKDVLIKRRKDLALEMAEASDKRWANCQNRYNGDIEACKKAKLIKPLDGIPMAVKDEVSVAGYTTSYGLDPEKIIHHVFAEITKEQESKVVTLMKDAGVIIIGKANQHIFGLGGTGENPHFPRQSNICSPHHVPGGSSSGTALTVALNLSPCGIGTDGGGSVSIPAAINGVPGLKPTLNKISTLNYDDAAPGMVSIGLIGKSFKDIATCYQASSERYPTSAVYEALQTLTIGVDPAWFEHAHPDVAEKTLVCLDRLDHKIQNLQKNNNSTLVKMKFMPENFRKKLWASHIILFGKGEANGKAHFIEKGVPEETMFALAMGQALTDKHVRNARKNKEIVTNHFNNNLFSKVNILAMPTTLTSAPEKAKNWLPQYREVGELNLSKAYLLSFNTALANLTGGPRITIPCGFDSDNLPVGLQLMGAEDSEYLLILLGDMLAQEMADEIGASPAGFKHKCNRPALFDPEVSVPTKSAAL